MKILFIGINPYYGSYRRGTPFSNNKTFWYLLNKAGLIHENEEDLRNDTILNHIYIHKFNQFYNLGFVNLINRPTHDISELEKGEENTGRRRILLIIRKYEPPTVCFIGKVSFAKFSKSKNFNFGWQKETLHKSKVFVMHFPIRGKASIRIDELIEIKEYCKCP